MKKAFGFIIGVLSILLIACAGEPQVITQNLEVTRVIEVENEVEVTREIEVTRVIEVDREVEVTREVEVAREVEIIVTPTATPLPPTSAGSLADPYTYGETAYLAIDEELDFTMVVTNVVRGSDALQVIKTANQFNDDPPEGFEFVVVRLFVEYTGEDFGLLEMNESALSIVTNGRILGYGDMLNYSPCCLEPAFELTLLPGGRGEGLIALPVALDDPDPLLLLGESLYFSLTPTE